MVRIKTICGLPNVDIFNGAPINDDHGFFFGEKSHQMAKRLQIGVLFEFFSSQIFWTFPNSILNSSM